MSTIAELLCKSMKDEFFSQLSPRSEASQISRIVKYCKLGSGPDAAVDPLLNVVYRHFKATDVALVVYGLEPIIASRVGCASHTASSLLNSVYAPGVVSADIVMSQFTIGKIVAFSTKDRIGINDSQILEYVASQISESLQSRYEEAVSDDFEFIQFRLQFLETLKMPLVEVTEAWSEFVQIWRAPESFVSSEHFWSVAIKKMNKFRSASRSFDFKIDASLRSLHHTVKCKPEQISALSSPSMSTLVSPSLSQVASPVMSAVASPFKLQHRQESQMSSVPQMLGQYSENVDEDTASWTQRLMGGGLAYPSTPRGSPRPGMRHLEHNSRGIVRPPPPINQSISLPSYKVSVVAAEGIAASSGLSSGLSSGSSSSSSSSANLTEDFGTEAVAADDRYWKNKSRMKSPLPHEAGKQIDGVDLSGTIPVDDDDDEENTVVATFYQNSRIMSSASTLSSTSTLSSASHINIRSLVAEHQNSLNFASGSSSATSSPHFSIRKSALSMTLRAIDSR